MVKTSMLMMGCSLSSSLNIKLLSVSVFLSVFAHIISISPTFLLFLHSDVKLRIFKHVSGVADAACLYQVNVHFSHDCGLGPEPATAANPANHIFLY